MGLGGDLMLEASLRAYFEHTGYRIYVALRPRFSDFMQGRFFRPMSSSELGPILYNAPYLENKIEVSKGRSRFVKFIDDAVEKILSRLKLQNAISEGLQYICYQHAKKFGVRYVYKDDSRFSYAAKVLETKMVWKDAPNGVDASLMGFLPNERPPITHPQRGPFFYELEDDGNSLDLTLKKKNIDLGEKYIAIETGTNREWFAELRAWPRERWERVTSWLKEQYPEYNLIQVGLEDGSESIEGSIDLRGQTTFREASVLLQRASLFIGTEGGLMHAARAVSASSLIIWGGVTKPDFAGYPDSHMILFFPLDCLHCGLLGECPRDIACMKNISVEDVCNYIEKALSEYKPSLINLNNKS